MTIDDHPRALAADILSQIITDIKGSRPTRTDGTSTTGFVYSQLSPGEMVSPRDFARPWSPMGGSPAPAGPSLAPPGISVPAAPPNANAKRAIEAAFKTAEKFDRLLMVTNDGTTQPYAGGGRHLSFQYTGILQALEAPPAAERPADETERINKATAVLFNADQSLTPLYAQYVKNQNAYAAAKGTYLITQARYLADPATADQWPTTADVFLTPVNQAFDQWRAQGAEEVEAAIATRESLGVPLEQGMIANARKLLRDWTVGVGGTTATTPYTFILPSEWSEIEVGDIGWTTLTRTTNEYQSHFDQHGYNLSTGDWAGSSSSSSGSAGVSVFGFGFSGSYSEADSESHSTFTDTATDGTHLTSNATDLSVEMQYGICEIVRPWLVTDLFQMQNWYLKDEKAASISDGTIESQVMDKDRRLPMIPTHFLVIRNVRITTSNWGFTRDTLNSYWDNHTRSDSGESHSIGGDVSIPVWGPLSLTGGYSHKDSRYHGDFKDEGGNDVNDNAASYFDGDTLMINGAQIVAYLGEIIPRCAPKDDPALADK